MTTDSKQFDWRELVKEHEGERYYEETVVYEFNDGKAQFKEPRNHVIEPTEGLSPSSHPVSVG
jgi:hypothetical protein